MSTTNIAPSAIAFELAQDGFQIFPLAVGTKVPHGTLAPTGFFNATTDLTIIAEWMQAEPAANWGVRTGPQTDGRTIVVLDCDCEAAYRRALAASPVTMTVQTHKGYHLYFKAPAGAKTRNRTKIWGKSYAADIRAEGGYVVAPGSFHPDGSVYTLIDGAPIADAPDWLLAEARRGDTDEMDAPVVRPSETSSVPMPDSVFYAMRDLSDGKHDRLYQKIIKPLVRLNWTDTQITTAVIGSPILRARMRKIRNKAETYVLQMIESARRWFAKHPTRTGVDPDHWVAQLRLHRPRGQQYRVWLFMAERARDSTTFVLSSRDVQSTIGVPHSSAHRAIEMAKKIGIIEVVDMPAPGSVRRGVYRLRNSPGSGTQEVVLHSWGTSPATGLSVPFSGRLLKHDAWGQAKLANAYFVWSVLVEHEKLTMAELQAITGYKRSSLYIFLKRLAAAQLIRKLDSGWVRNSAHKINKALDVYATDRGLTGYLETMRERIAQERATRLDDRYEWALRRGRRLAVVLPIRRDLVPDVRSVLAA